MTTPTDTMELSGEERARRKRNRFFKLIGLGMLSGGIVGFMTGYAQSMVENGSISVWIIPVLVFIAAAGIFYYTIAYFREVDELDRADNYFAGFWAMTFYIIALPAWQVLHDVGLTPEPQQWVIWAAAMAVMIGIYLARKAGLR